MRIRRSPKPRDLADDVVRRCILLSICLIGIAVMAILSARSPAGAVEYGTLERWFTIAIAITLGITATILECVGAARRRVGGRPEPGGMLALLISAGQVASFAVPLVVIRALLGRG